MMTSNNGNEGTAPPAAVAAADGQVLPSLSSTSASTKKPAEGEVYINKDGKKVRRVKRSEKRNRNKPTSPSNSSATQQHNTGGNNNKVPAIPAQQPMASAEVDSSDDDSEPIHIDEEYDESLDGSDIDIEGHDGSTTQASALTEAELQRLASQPQNQVASAAAPAVSPVSPLSPIPVEVATSNVTANTEKEEEENVTVDPGEIGAAEEKVEQEELVGVDPGDLRAAEEPASNITENAVKKEEKVPDVHPGDLEATDEKEEENLMVDPGDLRAALSDEFESMPVGPSNEFTNSGGTIAPKLDAFDPFAVQNSAEETDTTIQQQQQQLPINAFRESAHATGASKTTPTTETTANSTHGPMWTEAEKMASSEQPQQKQQITRADQIPSKITKKGALEQVIKDEFWSRAAVDQGEVAPDTLLQAAAESENNSKHLDRGLGRDGPSNAYLDYFAMASPEDERVDTKRVKVTQLMIVGAIGIIGGLFGSLFVQSACHFVTVDVDFGFNGQAFPLHFGMWKYSPMDSVFQGYSYCYPYDDEYTTDSPVPARIAGIVALVAGTLSLAVLWVYLLAGKLLPRIWRWAMRIFVLAAIAQALTFTIFLDDVCMRNSCKIGPGAAVSIIASLVWILMAYEMKHNSPIIPTIADPHIDPNTSGNNMADAPSSKDAEIEMGTYVPPVGVSA